jgi:hypothetical protein
VIRLIAVTVLVALGFQDPAPRVSVYKAARVLTGVGAPIDNGIIVVMDGKIPWSARA